MSGLIKNPLRGAESGGFAGFARGVGTGMLGLVVKPVVGVTDAATDVLQGGMTALLVLCSFFCFLFLIFVCFVLVCFLYFLYIRKAHRLRDGGFRRKVLLAGCYFFVFVLVCVVCSFFVFVLFSAYFLLMCAFCVRLVLVIWF